MDNYKTGDKIASIRDLASILNVSPNTIRRALKELFENGYLVSKRGKSGGIFIVEMPMGEQTYKWLAINPDVVDCISFCTKNPAPMLKHLEELSRFNQYWFVTITPYGKDIEPGVPDKHRILEDFKALSQISTKLPPYVH